MKHWNTYQDYFMVDNVKLITFRTRETLEAVIVRRVAPGTTIISDCWKSYSHLGAAGFQHLTVNHSVNFKDPETGAHTNSIESSWRHAKESMATAGRKGDHLTGNLARYMFAKSCSAKGVHMVEEFFRLSKKVYDPLKPLLMESSETEPNPEANEAEVSDDLVV